MLLYNKSLKEKARKLRNNMTDSERVLWAKLRGKQIHGTQFYRQKPIGPYIVDFYEPKTKLVIEVDGSQHKEEQQACYDIKREAYLHSQGLQVLRFDNRQVLQETSGVVEIIFDMVGKKLNLPQPLFEKEGG